MPNPENSLQRHVRRTPPARRAEAGAGTNCRALSRCLVECLAAAVLEHGTASTLTPGSGFPCAPFLWDAAARPRAKTAARPKQGNQSILSCKYGQGWKLEPDGGAPRLIARGTAEACLFWCWPGPSRSTGQTWNVVHFVLRVLRRGRLGGIIALRCLIRLCLCRARNS